MTTLLSATTALGSAATTMTLSKCWNVQHLSQHFRELFNSTCCVLSTWLELQITALYSADALAACSTLKCLTRAVADSGGSVCPPPIDLGKFSIEIHRMHQNPPFQVKIQKKLWGPPDPYWHRNGQHTAYWPTASMAGIASVLAYGQCGLLVGSGQTSGQTRRKHNRLLLNIALNIGN